jgi:hypothetical protein
MSDPWEQQDEFDWLCDKKAEAALLYSCLYSKNARIEARRHITGADFYQPHNETIYNAMQALDRHGKTVDAVTLLAALEAAGELKTGRTNNGMHLAVAAITTSGSTYVSSDDAAVADYCAIIRGRAVRRRYSSEAARLRQKAESVDYPLERIAPETIHALTGIRDAGAGDVSALSLSELMAGEDDDPTWVIPGLLEAGDRLMLTGTEGAGKSAFSRQVAVMAGAGLHPFTEAVIPPVRSLILDAENKGTQVRRQTRPLLHWLHERGAENPMDRVLVDAIYPRRINLCNDRDLAHIHRTIDAWQPQIVVLGPIYRMSPRALQTDDEAHPFLAALDTLTERGCALIVEAHAGHAQAGTGKAQQRDLRPRGSSALLGWPEFGLGLRSLGGGLADLEPWRGHREARAWPTRVRRSPGNRWTETHPDDRPPPPPDPGYAPHEDPQAPLL